MIKTVILHPDTSEAIAQSIDKTALGGRGQPAMEIIPFAETEWRRTTFYPSAESRVSVTLSTGKTVEVGAQILGFLRLLADELTRDWDAES